jgi:hypothetical protein
MRAAALSKWLDRHRTRKPRRTILGVQSFEARTVPAALTGSVYQDLNHNGARDAGEPGIAGVKVQLVGKTDGGQVVHMSAATDAQGAYSFTGLASGAYMLIEMHAAGFKNGGATPGSAGGTAFGPNVIKGIDVCGCDATGYNFGEVPAPPCSNQSHGNGGHDMCGCDDGGELKGNNGVGNGLDPQPPGDPPVNDGPGTSPGNPGNRGK